MPEVDVVELFKWLTRAFTSEEERELLIGCFLDDGENDDEVEIVGLLWPTTTTATTISAKLILKDGRHLNFHQARKGVVNDYRTNTPLVGAINAGTQHAGTQHDLASRQALLQAGIDSGLLGGGSDAHAAVAALFDTLRTCVPPPYDIGHKAYLELRKAAGYHIGIRGIAINFFIEFRKKCDEIHCSFPGDWYWRLATLLRDANRQPEAVKVADVLFSSSYLRSADMKLLASTCCGSALDIFEKSRNMYYLMRADQLFDIAIQYGIAGEQELVNLEGRLGRLKCGSNGCF